MIALFCIVGPAKTTRWFLYTLKFSRFLRLFGVALGFILIVKYWRGLEPGALNKGNSNKGTPVPVLNYLPRERKDQDLCPKMIIIDHILPFWDDV